MCSCHLFLISSNSVSSILFLSIIVLIRKDIYLNSEFQRIPRRDKKIFLSDQCKEIEGNNRMRKTRDLFKKIRGTKGIFHVNMGTMKDRNSVDLTEAEDIKRGW